MARLRDAYDADNTYVTPDDLRDRLTKQTVLRLVDVDTIDEAEQAEEVTAYLETQCEAANARVDAAICDKYDLDAGRPTDVIWLCERALTIAAFYAYTNGGQEPPDVLEKLYDEAVAELKDVAADDQNVPGLEEVPQTTASGKPLPTSKDQFMRTYSPVKSRHFKTGLR